MKKKKLLTIVVPAYNMEKYIQRCLDSLAIKEIMDVLEVLVINDGSEDSTLKIAQKYGKKYPDCFKIVDKENGNYGSAMNSGLQLSTGKYFRSLDADDWFDKEGIINFVKDLKQTDADIVVSSRFDFNERSQSSIKISLDTSLTFGKDEVINNSITSNTSFMTNCVVQGLTIKTDIIRQSGLRWSEGVFYTDSQFCYWPMKLVKTIRLVSKPVYVYFIGRNDQSVSVNSMRKNFRSFKIVANTIIDDYLLTGNRNMFTYSITMHVMERISSLLYMNLIYDGFLNEGEILKFDKKIKRIPDLNDLLMKTCNYHGIHYLQWFRKGKLGHMELYFLHKLFLCIHKC